MSLIIHRVAQYARFSSDNQRTESIDAQLRAMSQFCKQQHWQIVATYTDEARSATTDNRPQFQQMIADSGKTIITYEGIDGNKKWSRLETYGAKLVENITQSVARDLLMYSMTTMQSMDIVGHVHDEIIVECDMDTTVEQICGLMERTPEWAEGLLLRADGYECEFYMKK